MKSYAQRQSQLQEKRAAQDVGGRVQPGSGSTIFAKGDVRAVGKLRIECKTTSGSSFILKHQELLKIKREAQGSLEDWAFQIQFQRQSGMGKKFVVCDYLAFDQMWMEVATNEDHRYIEELSPKASQLTLHLSDLISLHGLAEEKSAALVVLITFYDDDRIEPKKYALTTWETYQGVRDPGA